ncbi:hypothetical protein [Polynucleobacter sp. MWH-UH2A]|uniref:hypothetical protein n=1 Tax=Polynucleobacter sp. MWH-UH2A TaxID=1855617 RepID=UPI001BFD447C|nr:hypothetical protein [Polynucleobacter sp. MWH-UH2A]QWD64994.1 hypothetical protein IC571_05080 [Polynucleobacter sp. MWH-UH2A]
MIAHFSSRLNQQINATLVAVLLSFCMLGTHWVGLSHNVSHLGFAKQTICDSAEVECKPAVQHSSEACHLFDALTLAGCIPPSLHLGSLASNIQLVIFQWSATQIDAPSLVAYQSQAPPSFIL